MVSCDSAAQKRATAGMTPPGPYPFLQLCGAAAFCCLPAPALADDLRGALIEAYKTNPTLQAARAGQRALDETVPLRKADARPELSSSMTYREFVHDSGRLPTSPDRQLSSQLLLDVPIYSGGGVRNAIAAAKTRVGAGQAELRGTESEVFSLVVAAYMDVLLNEAVVGLQRNLVQVLETDLEAASVRFEIGDLTRTDVAQAQSRLQIARSDARAAEANLVGARELYLQLVGKPPQSLEPPQPLPNLPARADEAVDIALSGNPDLIAATERAKAAQLDVAVAGAGRLPRISLFATGSHATYLGTLGAVPGSQADQSSRAATAGISATIPLFQGGRPAALRRQAQTLSTEAMEIEIAIERSIIAQVRAAFAVWQSAGEIIESSQTAVSAAEMGLEGVRAESSVGNRTILDILNAEQELLQARVRLVTARRNAYVAGFTLLAAMGRAEAQDLGLDSAANYDPLANYNRIRGSFLDWDNSPDPVATATRTNLAPAQDGVIPAR